MDSNKKIIDLTKDTYGHKIVIFAEVDTRCMGCIIEVKLISKYVVDMICPKPSTLWMSLEAPLSLKNIAR